uniref:RNA helicase n=1 Tax=Rhipicephalus pulchellus TaxID=72859 RepID=L7M0F3_RHIPC
MSDTCHQAGRARCGSRKRKRLKNRTVITDSSRPTPLPTAEPDSKMTVIQAPELKKKKRRNRKRRLQSSTEGPESSDLCSDLKKPKFSSDSITELTDTSTLRGTRNHKFVSCSAAATNSKDTPFTVTTHNTETTVACVNSDANTSGTVEDGEEVERRRIKMQLLKQRRALPIYPVRRELVRVVRQRDCVILIGETACGKTTQLPQYLHAAGLTKQGIIGITQPRRMAAITVADRVALEMGVEIGGLVGYSVRFDDTTSHATRIKYLTDGMLLREALLDPLLRRYAVVVLDEAHERTVNTDILFGVVKSAQKERQRLNMTPLKIVVMSATMDVDHFSHYFNNAPVYTLEGRQHHIEMMYAVKPQEDYVFSALVTVFQIHRNQGPGDILVFCTGQEEIESVVQAAKETVLQLDTAEQNLLVLPLYAALPSSMQLRVFEPAKKNWRKVIFSTNIAETSITIPGIKYVVDTGVVKQRTYQPGTGLEVLKVRKISKAQAWQRAGRAGRECSGICYRLYTKVQYEAMREHSIPEIQRCSLSGVVLQMLALGIEDVFAFDFMDKPSEKHLTEALDKLHQLGAVEKKEEVKLTALGQKMAAFPLEPRFAKIILCSKELGCTDEILTIISILSGDSVLYFNEKHRERAAEVWRKFQSNEGDHVMLLNVYKAYKSVKGNKAWCKENFVSKKNMMKVIEIRSQLADLCVKAGVPLRSCGQDSAAFRKCLASGLFTNVAELQKNGDYVTLDARKKVHIHPSSCLFSSSPACVVFTEMVETSKCYMRNLTVVDPDWLPDVAPQYFKKKRLGAKALS